MIHTVQGFGIVNKAEVDVFLELSCLFDDPADVDNLISGSSAFSKTSLNIWQFTVHLLVKPGLREDPYQELSKEEQRAEEKRKVKHMWIQSSKENKGEVRKPS